MSGDLFIRNCPKLSSLKGIPIHILGDLYCINTSVPQAEIDLCKNEELRKDWIHSELDIEEYMRRNRGKIKGGKFGL